MRAFALRVVVVLGGLAATTPVHAEADPQAEALRWMSNQIRKLMSEAGAALEAGDPDKALRAINEVLGLEPGLVESRKIGNHAWHEKVALRARIHQARKAWGDALQDHARVIQIEPAAASWYARALAHKERGDLASAIADLTEAIRHFTNPWYAAPKATLEELILLRADLREQSGEGARAKQDREVMVPAVRVMTETWKESPETAFGPLRRLAPDFPPLTYVQGWAHARQKHHEKALFSARKYVALLPKSPEAHELLGSMLGEAGQHAEAARAYRESLRLTDTASSLLWRRHLLVGGALAFIGHAEEALAHLAEAEARGRAVPALFASRIRAHLHLGQTKEAMAAANRWVSRAEARRRSARPTARALRARADVFEAMGDPELAAAERERADEVEAPEIVREATEDARKAARAGDFKRAAALISPAVERDGTGTTTLLARAVYRFKANDFAGTLADSQEALRRDPKVAAAHNFIGMVHMFGSGTPDVEEALRSFQRALALMPDDVRTLRNVATTYVVLGNQEGVTKTYTHLTKVLRRTVGLRGAVGTYIDWVRESFMTDETTWLAQWTAKIASASLREVLDSGPEAAKQVAELAGDLVAEGKHEAAMLVAKQVLAKEPNATALGVLGIVYQARKEWDAAQKVLTQALAIDGDHASNLNNLGWTLQNLGKLGEAERVYERAIQAHPNRMRPRYNLASVYQATNRPLDAIRVYGEIIKRKPTEDAYLDRAYLLMFTETGDQQAAFEQARHDLDAAREVNPEGARGPYLRGLLHYLQEDWATSIEEMNRAVALGWQAERSRLHFHRGTAFLVLGRNEEALKDLREAVRLFPRDEDALNNLAVALSRLDHPAEAARYFGKAIELAPEHPAYYDRRAAEYEALGEAELAAKDLAKAKALRTAASGQPSGS